LSTTVLAQDCSELSNLNYAQGELYAVFESDTGGARRAGRPPPQRLYSSDGFFAANEIPFAPNLRLIYVLDNPSRASDIGSVRRDFSGVMVARLVSKGADSAKHPPTVVRLYRDAVTTSRRQRPMRSNPNFPALTYYTYHKPQKPFASDSYLDQEFHTSYFYKDGEVDRRTNEPDERRAKFQFDEMKEAPPSNSVVARIASGLLGAPSALAATSETGFEAQIKYYPKSITPRCLSIDTRLPALGDQTLKITLTDLDHPRGIDAYESSGIWVIKWKSPVLAPAR
jgi:hypothetical protein